MNDASAVWLAIMSSLVGIVGTLLALLYRDLIRRIQRLEAQSSAILMAVMVFIGKQDGVPKELIDKVYNAATSGD